MKNTHKANSHVYKQRLYRGHVAMGIICSLLLYNSLFFGLYAIFMPYIRVWEKPSRHFPTMEITEINYEPMLEEALSDPNLSGEEILLDLPGAGEDPALQISQRHSPKIVFNPITQKRIKDEGGSSNLAMFLNGMHYGRPLKKLGTTIFGLVAAGVLFLIIGGLILISVLDFKGSKKSNRNIFSFWHRKLLLWGSAPLLIIVLCATVMGLSFVGSGPLVYLTTHGEKTNIRPLILPVLFPKDKPIPKLNEPVPMLPLKELIKKAQKVNSNINFQKLTLINWGDKSAKIKLEGYNPYVPFLNGVSNKPSIVLNGYDGNLIKQSKVMDRPWGVLLTDSVYFLHLLFGVDIFTRSLVFLLMLGCCTGIALGVMLWLEKKKKYFGKNIPFYHWVSKLSLAFMIGVIPATGILLNLQWLLPFDMKDRLIWQQGLFFDFWIAAFAWSFYRIHSKIAAMELLTLGGFLYFIVPVIYCIQNRSTPMEMIHNDMLTIFIVNLAFATLGVIFLRVAYVLSKTISQTKTLTFGR
ncbi:PepSY-associated TM helix domain-containing protein [Dethiosulfatarculus sandiegensis]|nr:PepSY-associated TM helix domain-containing protein [Dethiosulfatarculus sandiegensis]